MNGEFVMITRDKQQKRRLALFEKIGKALITNLKNFEMEV